MKLKIITATVLSVAIIALTAAASGRPDVFRTLDRQFLFAPHIVPTITTETYKAEIIVSDPAELTPDFDRRAYLAHLFKRITAAAETDEEKVVLWTRWLQDYMGHGRKPPVDKDGQAIYDPIFLLKHRIAHCGQTNRILIDGLAAAGFEGRLIQFVDHVGAEVSYEGGWHYIDADLFSFGEFIRNKDDAIASLAEILEDPELLVRNKSNDELYYYNKEIQELLPGYERHALLRNTFTSREEHPGGMITPYAWVKMATAEQENNQYYGWNYYRAEPLGE